MRKIGNWLKNPGGVWLILVYILTLVFMGMSICFTVSPLTGKFALISYTVYALAATLLAFSVYSIVRCRRELTASFIQLLKKNPITSLMFEGFGFRTMVGVTLSLGVSVAYSIFNGIVGIIASSVWYGALAMYYICLTFIRGGVVLRQVKSKNTDNGEYKRAKTYKNSGIVLLVLNVALSAAIAQMIFDGMGFSYGGLMIYVSATYSFTKIGMAIYNFVRAQRQDNPLVEAARNISLVDGAVSILALQTAMLVSFSDGAIDASVANTATGSAVSIFAYSLAIYMIVKGNKLMKKYKSVKNESDESEK